MKHALLFLIISVSQYIMPTLNASEKDNGVTVDYTESWKRNYYAVRFNTSNEDSNRKSVSFTWYVLFNDTNGDDHRTPRKHISGWKVDGNSDWGSDNYYVTLPRGASVKEVVITGLNARNLD